MRKRTRRAIREEVRAAFAAERAGLERLTKRAEMAVARANNPRNAPAARPSSEPAAPPPDPERGDPHENIANGDLPASFGGKLALYRRLHGNGKR